MLTTNKPIDGLLGTAFSNCKILNVDSSFVSSDITRELRFPGARISFPTETLPEVCVSRMTSWEHVAIPTWPYRMQSCFLGGVPLKKKKK